MVSVTATAERMATDAVFSWTTTIGLGRIAPETAAAEVQAIYARQGVVTPEAIVEAARDGAASLHAAFEWDDTVAAEAHREEQARKLLGKLVVSYRRTDGSLTQPTRYLVKLQARADEDIEDDALQAATEPHVYIPIRKVMDEEVLRRKYVREAFLSVVSWRRRYRDIVELASVFEAIDALGDGFGRPA